MTGENVQHTNQRSKKRTASRTDEYDPFVRGRYPVGVRTIQALDKIRDRLFPCEIWYPAAAQHAGHDIASGTQDFFTVPPGDTPRSQMAVRNAAARPGTYPPIVFSLLDHLLNGAAWDSEANLDPTRIGIVGHSFGGWTALAALTSSRVSGPWWRWRQAEVPSRDRGFSRRSLLSPGGVMFRRCFWSPRTTFRCHSPACTKYSKGPRQPNRW